jgi:hypothetical protein
MRRRGRFRLCLETALLGWLVAFWTTPVRAQAPAPPRAVLGAEIARNGPPVERPPDDPGPAPGPGLFYVPGEYVPEGNTVAWRAGFWAKLQPGWTWIPARWVRQSDGWSFQDGRWVREARPAAEDNTAAAAVSVNYVVNPYPTLGVPYPYGFGFGYGFGYPFVGGFGYPFGVVSPYPFYGLGSVYPYGLGFGWGFGIGYRPWFWW